MSISYEEYYKTGIKSSISLKNKISKATDGEDTVERFNIYKFCFMGLLRTGYPCKVVQHEKTVELDKNEVVSKKKKNAAILNTPDVIKEDFVVVEIDENYYECKLNFLKEIYGDEVYSYINGKTKSKKRMDHDGDEEGNIIIPDVSFDDDDDDAPKKEVKVKKEKKSTVVPYIKNDDNYPDDPENAKSYLSLLYNYHEIKVKTTKKESMYKCYVYPLFMDDKDAITTKIVAIVTTWDMSRVRCGFSSLSEKKSNGVTIEIDKINFMIRGKWEDGEFITSVNLIKNEETNTTMTDKMKQEVPAKNTRTSSFYQRVRGEDGSYINIFPLGVLRNDQETGIAPAILLVETEEGKITATQKSNGEFSVMFDGSVKTIQSYWQGNDLICNIVDTSQKNVFG